MIQYTCDLCGSVIHTVSGRRFVVKLEIYPIDNSLEIVPMDSDTDPIELMEKMIESADDIEIYPGLQILMLTAHWLTQLTNHKNQPKFKSEMQKWWLHKKFQPELQARRSTVSTIVF